MRAPRIVIEGPNGTGKSILQSLLVKGLREVGYSVQSTVQPSSITEAGRLLLNILRSPSIPDDFTLLGLFTLDRIALSKVERSELEQGVICLSSRCWLSSYVYQVFSGSVSHGQWEIFQNFFRASGGLDPDITILITPHNGDERFCYERAHPEGSRCQDFSHYKEICNGYQHGIDYNQRYLGNILPYTNRDSHELILRDVLWHLEMFRNRQIQAS